ncbi:lipoate--protein ligase family protein [Nostoc sp. FACHB-110]|uniref:lipoate--protein ligase family protein n=1 Tax=Nostoc sp. FACHB-110 TaxID=2692834 RepID=UPI001689832E|nr:biotin/lipoate A/B protein ligase family protein [Nostoc sp. FACHB-110]MBD2436260.1 lipoate--protein ligase family protein [Nostoc sp. FACHB-110]
MSRKQVWRLIPLLKASGNVQMAIDKWLLEQHHSGKQPATLRFYTWSPAAISLGYHQRQYPEAWQNLTWQGEKLDIVRRPTGGRAVLHQGDLTYSVITSGLSGNRLEVYAKICEFLIEGWRSLGVELSYGTDGRGYIHNPNCFGTATGADLILPNGAKFIGSAQMRRGDVILQHGSMRLQPDMELFAKVFGGESLSDVQFSLSLEEIMTALVGAARDCFAIEVEVQPLSELEWGEINAEVR